MHVHSSNVYLFQGWNRFFFPVAVGRVGKRDCWTKDVLCRVNMEDEVNNAHVT